LTVRAEKPIKRLLVVINPAAGLDRPILGTLNNAFKTAGIEWDAWITHKAGDAREFARAAAKDGWDVVAAHGGDGTVMEVADGLRGTDVPLAIFPGGTANVTASELGIPFDLPAAIDFIASGKRTVRTIDMAETPETTFMLRVGIGLDASMTSNTDQELKNRFGILAYAFSALNELRTLTPSKYHIVVDGKPYETEGVNCLVTNSGSVSIGNLKLAEKIDISDGLLDVLVFTNADLTTLLNWGRAMVTGDDSISHPQILHWQGHEIEVTADPPQAITIDGELIESSTIKASILPSAVKVIVPQTS